jgi:hypothetical protein
MIIRATKKLLRIAGVKPVKSDENDDAVFPGEWYAKTVKTGHPGKLVMVLFHNKTRISIICPTKSLNIAVKQLPVRVENYLTRLGFETLIPKFDLNSEIQIYTTDSKSTLAYMNRLIFNIEWHLGRAESLEDIDYDDLENIHSLYLFSIDGSPRNLGTAFDILKSIKMSQNRNI